MSHTLTAIMPKILSKGLLALRSEVLFTRLVNLDYSEEAKEKGSTIDVPISSAQTVTDVTPSNSNPATGDLTPETVQVVLDQWKSTRFKLNDKEIGQIMADKHFVPLQMEESFKALANTMNQSVAALHTKLYSCTGTAGTTPFGSGVGVASATQARKLLNQQLASKRMRRGILDVDAEAAALELAAFSDAEKVGSSDVKISGELGRKFGTDWYADNDVPTHTSGTLGGDGTTATIIKAATAHAVGVSTLTMTVGATNGAALLEGDIFTIAGDTQQYRVTAAVSGAAAADISVAIEPTLQVALTGSEAVTGVSGVGFGATGAAGTDHVANMVFQRDCFALAMRAPDQGLKELLGKTASAADHSFTLGDRKTGLIFRLEIRREYKQWVWELDALWGVKCVRAALGTKILG